MSPSFHAQPRFVVKSAIPARQVSEHARLGEAIDDLLFELDLRKGETTISGLVLVSARRLLADTYRLVSREPHARALPRLVPGPEMAAATLRVALRDAQTALSAFQRDHSEPDSGREDFWLVRESDTPTY